MSKYLRKELIEALASQRALLVVGSGISIAATGGTTTAAWQGLIEDGLERARDLRPDLPTNWVHDSRKLLKSRSTPDLIVVAQRVTTALQEIPGNHYAKWLRDSIGVLSPVYPGILKSIADLGTPVATTNYDSLLEDFLNVPSVTWREPPAAQASFRSESKAIVHLHGHWRDPDSIVFGYESYGHAIGDVPSQALIRAMASISSLVFIGAGQGIADPNFSGIMAWLHESLPENLYPPIVLLRDSDAKKQYKDLSEKGFSVLPYGPDYADLELFLADLAKDLPGSGTRSANTARVLGWDEMQLYLQRLHTRIRREFKPDIVIAMSGPGNIAPAYCWSLDPDDIPLVTAVTFPKRNFGNESYIQFYNWAAKAGWIYHESHKWHVFLPDILQYLPAASNILLFDDRVIGGRVQAAIATLLEARGYIVRRAAVIAHPDAVGALDYYEIKTDDDFLFPWGGKYGRAPVPRK